MTRSAIGDNILKKQRSKIKGGEYEGQYVMFSDKPVESIMFGDIEIKPAPRVSERVKGHLYVHNGIVRIWGGSNWKCTEHKKKLATRIKCGGGEKPFHCDHDLTGVCRLEISDWHRCARTGNTGDILFII